MYDLVGVNGNAYSIMGYVAKAMRKEGRSEEEINSYYKEATSKDYQHLLCVSIKIIDELNENSDDFSDDFYENISENV